METMTAARHAVPTVLWLAAVLGVLYGQCAAAAAAATAPASRDVSSLATSNSGGSSVVHHPVLPMNPTPQVVSSADCSAGGVGCCCTTRDSGGTCQSWTAFDSATQVCCAEPGASGVIKTGDSCCCTGHTSSGDCAQWTGFESSTQSCCEDRAGWVSDMQYEVVDGDGCCCLSFDSQDNCRKWVGFDTKTQSCCGDYDDHTAPAVMKGTGCCCTDYGGDGYCYKFVGYDKATQACCGDLNLQNNEVLPGTGCCCLRGSNPGLCEKWQGFVVGSQVCCGDLAVDAQVLPGDGCCCPDSADDHCQGFNKTTQECDDGKITPRSGPIPYTGTKCLGVWPLFSTFADLAANAGWSAYFKALYGQLPPATNANYPLCTGDFWAFWTDKLQQSGAWVPESNGECPSHDAPEGQRYNRNNAYSSPLLTWSWHPPGTAAYKGFSSNTLVEVSHAKDPFGDEHYGLWFVYARGTGVFFDLGNTIIFGDHNDAFAHFEAGNNEDMSRKAAAAGYDSIQFIAHPDHTNYPCDAAVGAPYMNIEIVATRLQGTYSCGAEGDTPKSLRQGWAGTLPCKCDNRLDNTNCVLPL